MGIVKAVFEAFEGVLSDQWIDIVTVEDFDGHTVVAPGVKKRINSRLDEKKQGSDGVISNGSIIFVPENTAAFIFDSSGIEDIIVEPGKYEYYKGQGSIFTWGSLEDTIVRETAERIRHGGIPSQEKQVAFINLREIRGIRFGTRTPQVYHDMYYDVDLEVRAHGLLSVKVVNPKLFISNYVPPAVYYYNFDDSDAKEQLLGEFLEVFNAGLNSFSKVYRVSELPAQAKALSQFLVREFRASDNWIERFGIEIVSVAIENIGFSEDSRELVNQFNANKLNISAYENVSKKAADIAAQQKMAQGFEQNGSRAISSMIIDTSKVNHPINSNYESQEKGLTMDEKITYIEKFRALLDDGTITDEEFQRQKQKILGD